MLKKFIFITFIFFFPILINSQTNYFTLRQLIDSALKNNYNLISNKYELNKAEYSNFTENYSTNIEVSFKNGYLYSDKKENEIYVRYNFPSPYKWHIDKEVKKAYSQYLNSVFELNKKKTIMIVKQAYYKCLYEKVKYQNLKKTFEFLQNYLITDSLSNDKKELNSLELMHIYYEKLAELDDVYNDYLLAISKLSDAASLTTTAEPADSILELYEIITKPDTSTRTPSRLFENIYNNELLFTKAKLNKLNTVFFPQFFIGYGLRNDFLNNHLNYWQVGISLPLSFFSFNKKNNLSYLQIEEKRNAILYNQNINKAHINELLILMNKCFDKLNNFYNYLIPNSKAIENAFFNKLELNDNIQIDEIKIFLKARNSISEYYKTILEYNLLAIELEVYTF